MPLVRHICSFARLPRVGRGRSGLERPRVPASRRSGLLRSSCAVTLGAAGAAALLVALITAPVASVARAEPIADCNEAADPAVRIRGCTAIIDSNPGLDVLAIAHMNRAIGRVAEGDLDQALGDLDAALEADPELVAALYNRGNVLLELGRTERAIADFGAVIRHMPDFALAWLNRGLAREHAGDTTGAAADYAAALKLDRKLSAARRGLARVKDKPPK